MKGENSKEVSKLQKNEEKIHDKAIRTVKSRFADKITFDKERVEIESAQLLEESGDIDSQVAFLKIDLDSKF